MTKQGVSGPVGVTYTYNDFNEACSNARNAAKQGQLGDVDRHLGTVLESSKQLRLGGVDDICQQLMILAISTHIQTGKIDMELIRRYGSKYNLLRD